MSEPLLKSMRQVPMQGMEIREGLEDMAANSIDYVMQDVEKICRYGHGALPMGIAVGRVNIVGNTVNAISVVALTSGQSVEKLMAAIEIAVTKFLAELSPVKEE